MKKLEVKAARQTLGLSQKDMAIALGYEGTHANLIVAKWESGTRPIPNDKAYELQMLCHGMRKVFDFVPIEDVGVLHVFCSRLRREKAGSEARLANSDAGE